MRQRLDKRLVELYPDLSRERAKALIMAGEVFLNGQREDKAGTNVKHDDVIELRAHSRRFVSRGGFKLQKAFETFDLDIDGCVYAVDVGYGQLDWKLRSDPRVVCMEKTNVRYVTPDLFDESISFSSADLSFISLTKVLPAIRDYLVPDGQIVALVKPQFEAGREKVGKKGVVRDPDVHRDVIAYVSGFAADIGLVPRGLTYSPIKGPEGNIEYLLWLQKSTENEERLSLSRELIDSVVDEAFTALNE